MTEKEKFLQQVRRIVENWKNEDKVSDKNKCVGVAFSILSLIDGCSIDSGKSYKLFPVEKCGEDDFFIFKSSLNEKDNIAGRLHDEFFKATDFKLD